ncbi:DUF222 domain-containing protein [Specibacter sp. NPDC057265]|uniref:HNH endonuclease signature motif containing protein n=1 Tax=Specibacter sp. NPDC057265 TaxID=3346075 RepID=UPI00362D3A33
MSTTATVPGFSGTHSNGSGVGGHVHQLLNLADALIGAAAALHNEPASDQGRGKAEGGAGGPAPFGIELAALTDRECVQWAQDLERLGTIQQALTVQVASEISQRTEAGRYEKSGVRNPVDMLIQSLRISAGEARRRIDLAQAVLPSVNAVTGEMTAAPQSVLGEAFFRGLIPQEQALQVAKFVQEASRLAQNGRISTDCRNEVETTLVATAAEEAPGLVRHIGNRIMSLLDPDGQKPSHADLVAKQGITFRKPRRGLVGIGGYLTLEQYEHLMVSIGRFTNPHLRGVAVDRDEPSASASQEPPDNEDVVPTGQCNDTTETPGADWARLWADSGPLTPETGGSAESNFSNHEADRETQPHPAAGQRESRTVHGVRVPAPGSMDMLDGLDPTDPDSTDPALKDDRTYAQKLLDGLLHCVEIAARTDILPMNGGLKAQLLISTTEKELDKTDGTGLAYTVYNGAVPLHLFDQTLCDSEITRFAVGEGQDILNVGRTQRLFTMAQRKLLFARDLGCTFPDCTALPLWCEAHHIIPWHDGGESNINNAALLCPRHHTLIHHSDWTIELRHGTPNFTAPYIIDPTQKLRHNPYHHAHPKAGFPPGSVLDP